MAHYLLVYDRRAGRLLRNQEFADRGVAMQARFDAESEYQGSRNIEIVVLEADSEESIRSTHARYFLTLSELAGRIA
jgi:hypothetical protein